MTKFSMILLDWVNVRSVASLEQGTFQIDLLICENFGNSQSLVCGDYSTRVVLGEDVSCYRPEKRSC